MRSLWRMLMGVVFAALVLAAGSVLVKGPEGEASPACAPLPSPGLVQSSAASADEVLPVLRSERHEERASTSRTDTCELELNCAPVSDGNGWPVTARTWTRAVYSVCPPEGMPG